MTIGDKLEKALLLDNRLVARSEDLLVSMDVDPVENMVVIPVPAPGPIVHTLVPVEVLMEFFPPILCDPNPLEMETEGEAIDHVRSSP